MKKFLVALALLSAMTLAVADEPTTNDPNKDQKSPVTTDLSGRVNLASKGKDVRDVISDLFNQAKKNFVLDKISRTELYLALNGVDFDEALEIVCKSAGLQYTVQNEIYYISKLDPAKPKVEGELPAVNGRLQGKLAATVLEKKFTTRLSKTDYRDVIKAIGRQTNVWLEVDASLPGRQIDAFLIDTTLKQGLDMLTQALGLEYKFTDNQSILIYKPNPNRITVLNP